MLTIVSSLVGGVAVSHAGSAPRSLESKAHVGPGARVVLDVAQWMKVTKCPTGPRSDS